MNQHKSPDLSVRDLGNLGEVRRGRGGRVGQSWGGTEEAPGSDSCSLDTLRWFWPPRPSAGQVYRELKAEQRLTRVSYASATSTALSLEVASGLGGVTRRLASL